MLSDGPLVASTLMIAESKPDMVIGYGNFYRPITEHKDFVDLH